MAKDYIQDIIPPSDDTEDVRQYRPQRVLPIQPMEEEQEVEVENDDQEMADDSPAPGERSIRNISVSTNRARQQRPVPESRERVTRGPTSRSRSSRWIVWMFASLVVIAIGVFVFFSFKKTAVVIIPRSQTVTFDSAATIVAYPEATAATGTLTYTTRTLDLEDSEVVPTQGTEHADEKATGNVTMYNDFSATPVKLIKNTRIATTDGLVFRMPSEVVIPGKTNAGPGKITVTVFADQSGQKYNIGPTEKFTLPGLETNAAMYRGIYASSDAAMMGGFSGDRPAAAPGAMDSAQSAVRDRLESQARSAAQSSTSTTVLSDMMTVTYQDLPQTTEATGGVRIHEKAHVIIPQIQTDALAQTVAHGVSANAENASLRLEPGAGFAIHYVNATSTKVGTDPIQFSFTGAARLVWNIDTQAITAALVGRDSGAFQTIVNGFPGVQEAHAKIEPFWKSTFPSAASGMIITLSQPTSK